MLAGYVIAAPHEVAVVVRRDAEPSAGIRVVRLDPGVLARQPVAGDELEGDLAPRAAGDDDVRVLPRRVDPLHRPSRQPVGDLGAHLGAAGVGQRRDRGGQRDEEGAASEAMTMPPGRGSLEASACS